MAIVNISLTEEQQERLLAWAHTGDARDWDIAEKVRAARDITPWEVDSGLPAEDH